MQQTIRQLFEVAPAYVQGRKDEAARMRAASAEERRRRQNQGVTITVETTARETQVEAAAPAATRENAPQRSSSASFALSPSGPGSNILGVVVDGSSDAISAVVAASPTLPATAMVTPVAREWRSSAGRQEGSTSASAPHAGDLAERRVDLFRASSSVGRLAAVGGQAGDDSLTGSASSTTIHRPRLATMVNLDRHAVALGQACATSTVPEAAALAIRSEVQFPPQAPPPPPGLCHSPPTIHVSGHPPVLPLCLTPTLRR